MRGRIRSVKPELFSDEKLWDLGLETGLPVLQAFVGLWCFADREGRFEWRPRPLKGYILPYWDGDFAAVLDALEGKDFIVRYTVNGKDYGYIRSFAKHQAINHKEQASELPAPDEPARPKKERGTGFVYVATYDGATAFKVGFAKSNPAARISDLSTGSPVPLRLVEYIAGTQKLENEIHRALAEFRTHREWFAVSDRSVAALHAWFTRDPRVVDAPSTGAGPVDDSPRGEGNGKGTEGNGNGTGVGTSRGRARTPRPAAVPLAPEPPSGVTQVPLDWAVTEEFYAEAWAAGVQREDLDEDVRYWRERKSLGGEFRTIEGFFRTHFDRLKNRRETKAFAASRPALARAGPADPLSAQADRLRLLQEQEAREEAVS